VEEPVDNPWTRRGRGTGAGGDTQTPGRRTASSQLLHREVRAGSAGRRQRNQLRWNTLRHPCAGRLAGNRGCAHLYYYYSFIKKEGIEYQRGG